MNHGSLFSGIGGFELAAEWMGWNNVFHCEINPFGKQVLNYYWPNSICYDDVKTTDFTIHRGTIDVISGGFPCQPYSTAGKRLGKEDERHLWPQMRRAIREIQPTWVVGENVSGLVNWNGGLVFEEVQADLETEGYEVIPFLLPACGVNAPHKRERVWFVAHARLLGQEKRQLQSMGIEQLREEQSIANTTSHRRIGIGKRVATEKGLQPGPEPTGKLEGRLEGLRYLRNVANTQCKGLQITEQGEQFEQLLDVERNDSQAASHPSHTGLQGSEKPGSVGTIREEQNKQFTGSFRSDWENFPTQSPVRSGNDGISSRLSGITVPKHRTESIKAYGNAIVPQVIHQIFKAIAEYENLHNENSYNSK